MEKIEFMLEIEIADHKYTVHTRYRNSQAFACFAKQR